MNAFRLQVRPASETQRLLADTLAKALGRLSSLRAVDPAADAGILASAWQDLCSLSLHEMMVPEARGGMGLGAVEAVLASYHAGHACLPLPLKEAIWASGLCGAAQDDPGWARETGVCRLGVASPLTVCAPLPAPSASGTLCIPGVAVPPGGCNRVLINCREAADDIGEVFLVRTDGQEVTAVPQLSIEECWQAVDFCVPASLVQAQRIRIAPERVARFHRLWQLMSSAEILGSAHAALTASLAHMSQRVQFKRPVGTRQSLQHMAADEHLACENLMLAIEIAALAWDEGSGQEIDQAVAVAVMQARSARRVLESAIQIHGAMGFTCEIPLHHLLRRLIRLGNELWACGDPLQTLWHGLCAAAQGYPPSGTEQLCHSPRPGVPAA